MIFCVPGNAAEVTEKAQAVDVAPAEPSAPERAAPPPAEPAQPAATAAPDAPDAPARAAQRTAIQPAATRGIDGSDLTDSESAAAPATSECHPDNPLASSLKHCRTERSGTFGSFWLGLDLGVAALHDDVETRIKAGPGIAGQVRLGTALWDQLVIGASFSAMTLRDKAGHTIWATECTEVGGAIIDCEDEPEEFGSHLYANLGSVEVGYQYRFRPWAPMSIVPGIIVGYAHAFGGLERSIACDDCGSVRLDVELDGAYLAPYIRVTFGRTGPFAFTVRPQYFLSGEIRHMTYVGIELGMP